ncbi:xylulose kinase [Flaviflexus ciconiae]|uniref:Xylulose kinase n=1 Tax=Flaviflexus ciconiae TaxID=2496867 RepID=A0A3Q9G747_9ACTO|nr:FGGY-family carbohydrate kinase [Flaviflexus ciconiae]AZQ77198.1 xylulose kinase [Flaviflexus ciconiae]
MNKINAADGPLVIAVDSSTTSSKAIIVDALGNVLALGKREIPLRTPQQGFGEHNPAHWWTSTNAAIAEAISRLKMEDRGRIEAIGMTHQRETFAPFTEDGTPLRNGILWLDIRAADQIKKYGTPEIHKLSGKPADVTPAIYKMAWVKEHEPEIWSKADKIVDVHAYLVYCLTGKWSDSVAAADSLGLFDIEKLDYDESLMEIAGVDRGQMADLYQPGEVLGYVKKEVRDAWNISKEIPVIAGLGDGQAAGIGAAAVDPEVAYLNMGTAVNAGVTSLDYQYGQVFRTLAGGVPNTYVLEILQSSGAFLTTWFRRVFGNPALQGGPDPELEALAAARTPGSGGLVTLPYWNAVQSPYWEPIARGGIVGWRGTHGPGSMYRSLLEAISMEMARSLRGMEEATGVKLQTVRAMGGGVRSKLWRQIMTDAIGLPITACKEDEISALGAGVVAMASTGVFGDTEIATAAKNMAQFTDSTEPNEENHKIYQELGAIQGRLYSDLKETNDQLHEFARRYPDAEVSNEDD